MTSNEKVPGVEPWPRPPELTITWYDSPEDVHNSLWGETAAEHGVTVGELLQGSEVGGLDENGQEVSVSQEQLLEGMRAMGCWGWVDTELNVIHAWMAPDADPGLVAHFLAHEIGHVTGHPDPDDFQEEMRAEQFGHVASQALRLLREAMTRPGSQVEMDLSTRLEVAASRADMMAGLLRESHGVIDGAFAPPVGMSHASRELLDRIEVVLGGWMPKVSAKPIEPSSTACQLPSKDHMADLLREALVPLRTGLGFVRNFHIIDRIEKALGPSAASCWCQACRPVTVDDMRLVVCPDCGNKRCPRASDHVYPCTGSNEPGQSGSADQAREGV
ncbi:hypothetical protein [Aeromonas dhakensis]|uniref:hypothetical protein n=1 Tax=Aeromonas dhakensis TaxID=196024 RepID=UPI00244C0E39|nr:hypothetical protein [Aeromonas dhakensis]MDH0348121.1 hypothetical protein [Aeromonas dhakensis]